MSIPVFCATIHGQTRHVAERIAELLSRDGHDSRALDVASAKAQRFDWPQADGVVVAASLRAGSHHKCAEAFVRANVDHLNAVPSWFVSVSLSAASPDPRTRLAAEQLAHSFAGRLGWTAPRVGCVAGCPAYTRDSPITRRLVFRIARREHAPTDASRDHELTDWAALAVDTGTFSQEVHASVSARIRATHYRSDVPLII